MHANQDNEVRQNLCLSADTTVDGIDLATR